VVNRIDGKNVWFTIAGSCLSRAPTSDSALLSISRTTFLGHAYRVMATSTVRYPTAHGAVRRTATAYSAVSAP
jgi:hypothetical protein